VAIGLADRAERDLRDLGPAAIIFALALLCLYTATRLGITPVLLLGLAV